MHDWTKTRLNVAYHWKTLLLWAIGMGGAIAFSLWHVKADAWVQSFQPFPEGEATVVMQPYCRAGACSYYLSVADWGTSIQVALRQWNNAGADWVFHEEWGTGPTDPCRPRDGQVLIIIADPDQLCPGDGPMRYDARTEYGSGWTRIYLSTRAESIQGGDPSRLLLHEFGHAVGLGHPDGAGQDVRAVMNSVIYYNQLQPDDIEGIRALYPAATTVSPSPLRGLLENPGNDSRRSGIGIISGWVCEANEVTIELSGDFYHQVWRAAYGTNRADTQDVCGDGGNGFGLLFNWNLLGNGKHQVVAFVDGVELGRALVTVTTLGEEFLQGASGEYVLEDFPSPGRSVSIEWEQSLQNFVIIPSGDEPDEPQECQFPDIPGACGEDG